MDFKESIKATILLNEARGFITNTNNLYSINNGPFPNTGLEYIKRLLFIYKVRNNRQGNQVWML